MADYHKHKGAAYSDGKLKSHPISQGHKDPEVQKQHNLSIGAHKAVNTQKTLRQAKEEAKQSLIPKKAAPSKEKQVFVVVDNDNYVNIDLDDCPPDVVGIKLKFTRKEGNKKRMVALLIDKEV